MTASLRSLGHEWHETAGLGTDEFCELVRDSGIDVLIDLAGHTAGNRLVAFAPARAGADNLPRLSKYNRHVPRPNAVSVDRFGL